MAGAAAFLFSVGPAIPTVAAATPTASAPADATPTTPPVVIAPTAPAVPAVRSTSISPTPPVVAPAARTVRVTRTRAQQVIAIARTKLGRPWVFGAAGPSVFDCSGLVIYAFRQAGLSGIVGSSREVSAFALYARFQARGLTSRTTGQPGDLVIWGGGTHVGIYLGNGMAISTLVTGVRIHAVRALTTPFTAYLHTGIAQAAAPAIPPARKTPTAAAKAATVTSHRITTHALRLRSGPSTAAGVIATLAAHAKVGVVRLARDHAGRTWYRVLVGGRLGWVAGWFTRTAS